MIFLALINAAVAPSTAWFGDVGGWATITPSGLLIIAVMMVFLGLLIPRWVYMRLVAEVEYLRKALKESQETERHAVQVAVKALGSVERVEAFLEAIKSPSQEGGDDDEVAVHSD